MNRIIVDKGKCSGCRICELICSYRDNSKFNPRDSKIRVLKQDELGVDNPILCHQCAECPPVDACPTKAFQRTSDAIVQIETAVCTACYACVGACPHRAIFQPSIESSPLVCDLCHGTPLCVKKCPTHALTFGTMQASPFRGDVGRGGVVE